MLGVRTEHSKQSLGPEESHITTSHHSEMGKAGSVTLKAQFLCLGNIFRVDESQPKSYLTHSFYLIWKQVGHFEEDF